MKEEEQHARACTKMDERQDINDDATGYKNTNDIRNTELLIEKKN